MEIASTTSIYIWLLESVFIAWLASLIIIKKQYRIALSRFMLAFFVLCSIGAALWSVPPLLTTGTTILAVTSIVGDILFQTGLSMSWLVVWYLFFKPRGVNIFFFVIPIVIYLTAMAIFTAFMTWSNPPFHRGDEYVNFIDERWSIAYTLIYLPLPILGVYFLYQAGKTNDAVQKFRATSWGLIHLAVGFVGLSSYFLNFSTRNTVVVAAISFFVLATLLYRILRRKA